MKNNQTHYYPSTSQDKAFTDGVNASATAIGAQTTIVRLLATGSACRVNFEKAVVATDMKLVVGVPEYFTIQAGAIITVRGDGGAGSLNITEMTQ